MKQICVLFLLFGFVASVPVTDRTESGVASDEIGVASESVTTQQSVVVKVPGDVEEKEEKVKEVKMDKVKEAEPKPPQEEQKEPSKKQAPVHKTSGIKEARINTFQVVFKEANEKLQLLPVEKNYAPSQQQQQQQQQHHQVESAPEVDTSGLKTPQYSQHHQVPHAPAQQQQQVEHSPSQQQQHQVEQAPAQQQQQVEHSPSQQQQHQVEQAPAQQQQHQVEQAPSQQQQHQVEQAPAQQQQHHQQPDPSVESAPEKPHISDGVKEIPEEELSPKRDGVKGGRSSTLEDNNSQIIEHQKVKPEADKQAKEKRDSVVNMVKGARKH